MGGSSSRFDETDWDKADGKIASPDQTIDNAPPTDSYGVYYLTKLGVNQRDYNMTDSDSNLLYSTRAVEGTLAWFDVLGKDGENDYKLRVQVDLSRGYWVVYHYGIPAFEGQMWDIAATEGQVDRDGWRKPLFRRACITVTWARYHAVVDLYQPAPQQENEHDDESNDENNNQSISAGMPEEKKTEDVASSEPTVVDASKSESTVHFVELCCSVEDVSDDESDHDHSAPTNEVTTDVGDEPPSRYKEDVINSQCTTEDSNDAISHASGAGPIHASSQSSHGEEEARPQLEQNSLGASIKWVQSKAAATMESVAAPYLPANREEGVITLGKPVLKVQEINSIVGQHQTMLIREKEARQLKCEELLTEAKFAREARATSSAIVEGASDNDPLDYLWSYQLSNSKEEVSDSENYGESAMADTHMNDPNKVNENDSAAPNILYAPNDGKESKIEHSSSDDYKEDQPLVGYWSWDNSIRVHRMKMHVGKNADLALHIVLAVVTNQLRYERHAALAVAM